ncbi:MAG: 7-cyano-7-deazaguanine synthase QueC [Candidatus Omnitrophica bacterium]|nr:7-cyano-7-deazaguanine synthase QueC [Candidatus Omnitrophota bacterium]
MVKKAVCLISGGMDSFVSAAIAKHKGYKIYALTVNYGQKNKKEISSAVKIAEFLKVERHLITKAALSWTKSALTDAKIKIPREIRKGEIPLTYVPARNTIFISIALALAETVDAGAIFIGVNAVDFSGYPDCRPEYIRRFQRLINSATKKTCGGGSIRLQAPLLRMSKEEIVKKGLSLGLDFSITWSCYKSGKKPCGQCPSCIIRAKGFSAAQTPDLIN